MSIQSEINRIKGNIDTALETVASTGVTVSENANSDDLPDAVSALANEKQDKSTALTTSGGTLINGGTLTSQSDDQGEKTSILFTKNAIEFMTDSGDMAGIRVSGTTFLGETTTNVNIRGKKVTIGGEMYNFSSNDVITVTESVAAGDSQAPEYSVEINNLVDPTAERDAVPKKYVDDNFMSAPEGGTAGQVMTKTESGVEWQDAPSGIPEGGTEGQMLYQGANGAEWGIPPYLGNMPQLDYSQMKSLHALGITDLNDILEPGTYVGMSNFGGYPEIANVPDFAFGLDAFFLNVYKFVDPTDSSNVVLSQTLYPIVRSDNAGAGELGGFYRQAFGHTSGAWLPWSKVMEAQHISFTPTSTVTSENVQHAIEEVQGNIPDLSGGTTGQMLAKTAEGFGWKDAPVSYVTVTPSGDSFVTDTNYTEIKTLYDNGATVMAKVTDTSGNTSVYNLVGFRNNAAYFGFIDINADGSGIRGLKIDNAGAVTTAASFMAAPYIYFESSEALDATNVQDAIEEVFNKLTPIETKIEKYEPAQIIIAPEGSEPAVVDGAILITYEA